MRETETILHLRESKAAPGLTTSAGGNIGVRGFEPPASRSRTVRSARLSYTPNCPSKLPSVVRNCKQGRLRMAFSHSGVRLLHVPPSVWELVDLKKRVIPDFCPYPKKVQQFFLCYALPFKLHLFGDPWPLQPHPPCGWPPLGSRSHAVGKGPCETAIHPEKS